jgi:hypothetical protein
MKIQFLFFFVLGISACSSKFDSLTESANKAVEQITCPNSEGALFDVVYQSLHQLKQDPRAQDLKAVFQKVIEDKKSLANHKAEILNLTQEFYSILEKLPAENLYEKLKKDLKI